MSRVFVYALLVSGASAVRTVEETFMHANATSVQLSSSKETTDVLPLIVSTAAAWIASKVGETILKEVGKTLAEEFVGSQLSGKGTAAIINLDRGSITSGGVVFSWVGTSAMDKLKHARFGEKYATHLTSSGKPKYAQSPFGSAALINMDSGDYVQVVANTYKEARQVEGRNQAMTVYDTVYGRTICEAKDNRVMPGRVYIYTGSCGDWRSLSAWEGWHKPDFAEEMCGTPDQWNGDETKVGECMTYVACALEQMYWIDFPHPKGNVKNVPATLQCSDAFTGTTTTKANTVGSGHCDQGYIAAASSLNVASATACISSCQQRSECGFASYSAQHGKKCDLYSTCNTGSPPSLSSTFPGYTTYQLVSRTGEDESDDSKWEFNKERNGFFHGGWECSEHLADDQYGGKVGWCGTDGLCCRHPGMWPAWSGKYYGGGCERKGCHGWHCCVHK